MNNVTYLFLRRMRVPLVLVILLYTISVFGLAVMPGVDPDRVAAFLDHRQELGPGVVQLVDGDGPAPRYLMYSVEASATDPTMLGPDAPLTIGRLGVLANGGATP